MIPRPKHPRLTQAQIAKAKPLPRRLPAAKPKLGPAAMAKGQQLPRRFGPPNPRAGRPPDNIAKVLGGRSKPIGTGRPVSSPRVNPIKPPRPATTTNPVMPGGIIERYPAPEKGTLRNPFTDTMTGAPPAAAAPAAPSPGPQLARQVSNAGSRGQNARYHVGPGSGLTRGERGWTDGVYWYDDNGLSLDRPDSVIAGLPGADESEAYDPWSGRTRSSGGAPSPIASALSGGGGFRSQPAMPADLMASIFAGPMGATPDLGAFGLPPGMENLPPQLLELIRGLLAGGRTMAPPPAGSVL